MPILWPLKLPERGNAITQRKTLKIEHSCSFIHHTIWIYMYPFPHLAVILTMLEWVLETPKNRGFCFNNSKTRLFVLYSQNYAARALPILFNTPPKIPTQIKHPKKILAKFSYQKKSRNRKFQTQKILPSSSSLEIPNTPPGAHISRNALAFIRFSIKNFDNGIQTSKQLFPDRTKLWQCFGSECMSVCMCNVHSFFI